MGRSLECRAATAEFAMRILIDLTTATLDEFIDAVFVVTDTEKLRADPREDRVDFQVDAPRQVVLLAQLFRQAGTLPQRFSLEQIERGLWRIMGEHSTDFTAHVWNPDVAFAERRPAIQTVYDLYDSLLAGRPFESIDFVHPDQLPRRFRTIDYMVPDLLLDGDYLADKRGSDRAAVRDEFFATFRRLLQHPAPVAQYAALHGLGHLKHRLRPQVIDQYLADHAELAADRRTYAEWARQGRVL
jgi:hypothetical protein